MFRLDDVQAWWCEDIARTVMDTFLAHNTPINVGIVGEYLDQSAAMSAYLASIVSDPLVEMTTHSHRHISFKGETVAWQQNDLQESVNMIASVTGTNPLSFITPYNEFDANTAVALAAVGLNVMSASCVWNRVTHTAINCPPGSNVVAPNLLWNGIYSLPAGAVLGNIDYWTNYQLPGSVAEASGWITEQIGK